MSAASATPTAAVAEVPKRCNLCHWLRPISDYRRQGKDRHGRVKRRAVCLLCERAKKHGEDLPSPDPSYVPPTPKPPPINRTCSACGETLPISRFRKMGQTNAAGEPKRRAKCKGCQAVPKKPKKIGWRISFGCPAERRLVTVGTTAKPEGKIVGVPCPACLDPTPHAVVHMARPWIEGETVEAEVTLS
jgi:hypothetical protein